MCCECRCWVSDRTERPCQSRTSLVTHEVLPSFLFFFRGIVAYHELPCKFQRLVQRKLLTCMFKMRFLWTVYGVSSIFLSLCQRIYSTGSFGNTVQAKIITKSDVGIAVVLGMRFYIDLITLMSCTLMIMRRVPVLLCVLLRMYFTKTGY